MGGVTGASFALTRLLRLRREFVVETLRRIANLLVSTSLRPSEHRLGLLLVVPLGLRHSARVVVKPVLATRGIRRLWGRF